MSCWRENYCDPQISSAMALGIVATTDDPEGGSYGLEVRRSASSVAFAKAR